VLTHKLESTVEPIRSSSPVASAKGKLGVMIPGMGAVATTLVAGVEAVRKRIALPIGSITQMGTIRLGKLTEGRFPRISEFVPLAGLRTRGAGFTRSVGSLAAESGSGTTSHCSRAA
jgi:myo-inositol-1-phosphate synthase